MSDLYSTSRKANKWQYLFECLHEQVTTFLEDEEDAAGLRSDLVGLLATERNARFNNLIDDLVDLTKAELKAEQERVELASSNA